MTESTAVDTLSSPVEPSIGPGDTTPSNAPETSTGAAPEDTANAAPRRLAKAKVAHPSPM